MATAGSPSATTSSVLNTWSGSSPSASAASMPYARTPGSWSYSCTVKATPAASRALHGGCHGCTLWPMRVAAEPSSRVEDYPFSHRLRVRFAETDLMGIVHHSRYLPYLEEARVAYLRHIGHPYGEWRDCRARRRRARGVRAVPPAAALRRRGRRPPPPGVGDAHDVPDGLPADGRGRSGGDGRHRPRPASTPPAAPPASPTWLVEMALARPARSEFRPDSPGRLSMRRSMRSTNGAPSGPP